MSSKFILLVLVVVSYPCYHSKSHASFYRMYALEAACQEMATWRTDPANVPAQRLKHMDFDEFGANGQALYNGKGA